MAIIKWEWDFGDGDSSNEMNPVHIYPMAGEYVVTLTVTDDFGVESTASNTVYVYDFDYSGNVPNTSLTTKCYRTPVRGNEGYGVSEYKDGANVGRDWIWPPALLQIGKCYDSMKREIILVLDSKTQREYQINDMDVWKDRAGTYEGNEIWSEIHQKAHQADAGEHVSIRHIEHHEYFKSFDRKVMENAAGYDSEGLPLEMRVDNQLFSDEKVASMAAETKKIPRNGDLVFNEKVEARNLQLRTLVRGAPYLLTGVVPYYETVDKQQGPSLRVMSEDGYQEIMSSMPLFHVSRHYNPILNLASGESCLGTYAAVITGPDGKQYSAITMDGVDDIIYAPLPNLMMATGDISVYMWINGTIPAAMPLQLFSCGILSLDLQLAGIDDYSLQVTHNGVLVGQVDLDYTAADWAFLAVVRDGLNIKVYENKALIGTFPIASAPPIGNTAYVCNMARVSIFDICMVPRALTQDAIEYYFDNVLRGGDEVLGIF